MMESENEPKGCEENGKNRPKKVKEEDRNIQTRAGNTAHPAKTYALTSVLQVRVQS